MVNLVTARCPFITPPPPCLTSGMLFVPICWFVFFKRAIVYSLRNTNFNNIFPSKFLKTLNVPWTKWHHRVRYAQKMFKSFVILLHPVLMNSNSHFYENIADVFLLWHCGNTHLSAQEQQTDEVSSLQMDWRHKSSKVKYTKKRKPSVGQQSLWNCVICC